ncbi:peptidase c14 caspase catalytic subunit p20, partial [Mesorhizobium sp. M7A.F.Ca.CA.001.15.1.1]
IDLNAPLIVGEATTQKSEAGSDGRNVAANPSGADDAQLSLDMLRQKIPRLASDEPIFFDHPVDFGDPEIDGKSIAELIKGKPRFSPVEGLDKSVWEGKHCDGCHEWNEARLCEQSKNFAANDVSVLRLQHPLGTRFKVALAKWAQGGCK